MKIGQSLSSTPIGGWPEDEMYKWGSYFGLSPKFGEEEIVVVAVTFRRKAHNNCCNIAKLTKRVVRHASFFHFTEVKKRTDNESLVNS